MQLAVILFPSMIAAYQPPLTRRSVAFARRSAAVDVADLGVTLEDLKKPLDPEIAAAVTTEGYESTARAPLDEGCAWTESPEA